VVSPEEITEIAKNRQSYALETLHCKIYCWSRLPNCRGNGVTVPECLLFKTVPMDTESILPSVI